MTTLARKQSMTGGEEKVIGFPVEMRARGAPSFSGHPVYARAHIPGSVLLKPRTLRELLQFQLIL